MDLAVGAVKTFARLAHARRVVRQCARVAPARFRRRATAWPSAAPATRDRPARQGHHRSREAAIFRAAQHALGLHAPASPLDVGGGASSWCSCTRAPLWLRQPPLGAARLAERFLASDPPTARQVARLEKHSSASWARSSPRPARGRGARDRHLGDVNTLVAIGGGGARARSARSTARAATAREVRRMRGACSRSRPPRAELPGNGREARRPDSGGGGARGLVLGAPAPRS